MALFIRYLGIPICMTLVVILSSYHILKNHYKYKWLWVLIASANLLATIMYMLPLYYYDSFSDSDYVLQANSFEEHLLAGLIGSLPVQYLMIFGILLLLRIQGSFAKSYTEYGGICKIALFLCYLSIGYYIQGIVGFLKKTDTLFEKYSYMHDLSLLFFVCFFIVFVITINEACESQ